jgi:hypothetical protein
MTTMAKELLTKIATGACTRNTKTAPITGEARLTCGGVRRDVAPIRHPDDCRGESVRTAAQGDAAAPPQPREES